MEEVGRTGEETEERKVETSVGNDGGDEGRDESSRKNGGDVGNRGELCEKLGQRSETVSALQRQKQLTQASLTALGSTDNLQFLPCSGTSSTTPLTSDPTSSLSLPPTDLNSRKPSNESSPRSTVYPWSSTDLIAPVMACADKRETLLSLVREIRHWGRTHETLLEVDPDKTLVDDLGVQRALDPPRLPLGQISRLPPLERLGVRFTLRVDLGDARAVPVADGEELVERRDVSLALVIVVVRG